MRVTAPNMNAQAQAMALCTPYSVSTITANGSVGGPVRIESFFTHARVADGGEGIQWLEYGVERERGVYPKKRKEGVRRKFGDQVSFYLRLRNGYMPHVKIFENGNLHMTGVRHAEDGREIERVVVAEVRRIAAEDDPTVTGDPAALSGTGQFIIRMINCDFTIPFHVRRRELHVLLSSDYDNVCIFQPGSYPGVKLEYYWNTVAPKAEGTIGNTVAPNAEGANRNTVAPKAEGAVTTSDMPKIKQDGNCKCTKLRVSRRRVSAMTNHPHPDVECTCKKVTVAVFESGRVLITGANDFAQVNDAYAYITGIVKTHKEDLQRRVLLIPPPMPKKDVGDVKPGKSKRSRIRALSAKRKMEMMACEANANEKEASEPLEAVEEVMVR